MRAWCLVVVAAGLVGCPTSSTAPPEPTPPPTDTGEPPDPGPRTDVSGTVVDADGAAIEGAQIRFCRGELCLNATTDAQGAFGFERVAAAPTSLEVVGPFDDTVPFNSVYATALTPITLQEEVPRAVTVALPLLGAPSPLGEQAAWHDLGGGLEVELAVTDLTPPPLVPAEDQVAGVRVATGDWPPIDTIPTPVALWYVAPFDHHGPDGGIPVRFTDDGTLGEGATVRVWVGDYTSSTWLDAGTLTVTDGVATGDARLPLMSTVAFVLEGDG